MHDEHSHAHRHAHDHHHHDHDHSIRLGHNHLGGNDHLHSHTHGDAQNEALEDLKVLATAFVDGFRKAEDKPSYLRLSGIAFHRKGADGLKQHLVDAQIVSNWQIGTASPAFGSRELAYLPYPAKMVTERESMTFTYVSITQRSDIDLLDVLKNRSSDTA